MTKSVSRAGKKLDLKKPGTAAKFRAAAKAYTLRATANKAAAIATLHREGILTPTGRLSRQGHNRDRSCNSRNVFAGKIATYSADALAAAE